VGRWADIRRLFSEYVPNAQVAPGLVKMCQAMRLQFVGKAHSGIDDSLNIARVCLALMQDYNAVFTETSSIKNLTQGTDASKLDSDQAKGNEPAPLSPQASMELRTLRSVACRLSLILAAVPAQRAEANLKGLKLSRDEIKAFLAHVRVLGHLPLPDNPGQLRRYRAALGAQQMELQLKLEAAWAASTPEDDEREEAVKRVEEVSRKLNELPELRCPGGSEPLATGKWLMDAMNAKPGPLLGRMKDYLHYLQVAHTLSFCSFLRKPLQQHDLITERLSIDLISVQSSTITTALFDLMSFRLIPPDFQQ
jgi:hypothetical protein